MDDQLKKLNQLSDNILKKIKFLSSDIKIKEKSYTDLTQELAEINSELILSVQKTLSLEFTILFDRVFNCMREIINILLVSTRKSEQSPKNKVNLALQIPQFINALQLGSVHVLNQVGPKGTIHSAHDIPWNEYKSNGNSQSHRQPKMYAEKETSTVIDYYQNCISALDRRDARDQEVESIIEYTNDTIHLISEALNNRVRYDYTHTSDSKELERIVSELQFNKFSLEAVVKETDMESLKLSAQNFDFIQSKIKDHIRDVQKMTAERLMVHFHAKQMEQDKKKNTLNDMKNKIKMKVMKKPDDCRCALYVNDIFNLKMRQEQLEKEILKQVQFIQEKETQIKERDLQIKILENKYHQSDMDYKDIYQKYDQINKEYRRVRGLEKKSSENLLSMSNDEVLFDGTKSLTAKGSQENNFRNASLNQNQNQNSQHIQNNNNDNQQFLYQKNKNIMVERAIKLVSVLEQPQLVRRLTQLQGILESRSSFQLNELGELIKDIEDHDLNESQQERFKSKSNLDIYDYQDRNQILNQARTLQSQRFLEKDENRQGSKVNLDQSFSANEDSNIIRVQVPEDLKNQLKIPVTNKQRRGSVNSVNIKNRRNSSRIPEGLNLNNNVPPLSRSKSSQMKMQQQLSRSNSIKLKDSKHNKNPNLLQNPYGTDEYGQSQTDRYNPENTNQTDRVYLYNTDRQYENDQNYKSQTTSVTNTNTNSPMVMRKNPNNLKSVISETEISEQQNSSQQMKNILLNSPEFGNVQGNQQQPFTFQQSKQLQQSQQYQLINVNSPENANNIQFNMSQSQQKNLRWKQKIIDQLNQNPTNEESFQKQQKNHTQKQSFNASPRDQAQRLKSKEDQIKEYIQYAQDEKEKKYKEEKVYFDQSIHDMPDETENDIIQKAMSKSPGFEVANDVNENIMFSMFKNLESNPQLNTLIKTISYSKAGQKVDYQEFREFVNKLQNSHKKCGKDCMHLLRFYLRLGFVSTKYLNRRKTLKLSKPTILPGFPKIPE